MSDKYVPNRDFKGVWIPREIWEHSELTIQEMVFFVEIDSLDNEDGCFAGNAHFSKFFNLSKGRCSQVITSLRDKGMISVEFEREGKEIKKRILKIVGGVKYPKEGVVNFLKGGIKFPKEGYLGNDEESNTCFSNTKESNTENIKHNASTEKKVERQPEFSQEVYSIVDSFYKKKSATDYNFALKTWNRESQAKVVDMVHRIDNFSYEDIEEAIMYSITDDFWMRNVLSLASLRKKGKNGLTKFVNLLSSCKKSKSGNRHVNASRFREYDKDGNENIIEF